MAGNKLKSTAKPKAVKEPPQVLRKDKEAEVKVKDLVRDERTHKVAGILCLLVAAYLFIAFTSYIFTWQSDQDKVFDYSFQAFFFSEGKNVENLLGRLGAFTAHWLIYEGIGVSAYFICYFFLAIGLNFIVGHRVLKIGRVLRYVFFGILFFSTALAFAFQGSVFSWGGAFGILANQWLNGFIGWLGTLLLLIVAALVFLVWKFNFSFRLPARRRKPVPPDTPADIEGDMEKRDVPVSNTPQQVRPAPLGNGNALYNEPDLLPLTIKPPVREAEDDGTDGGLQLIEKEDPGAEDKKPEPALPLLVQEVKDERPVAPPEKGEDLKLEINPVSEEEDRKKTSERLVREKGLFEPTLDLKDYRYPSLDLLENHGSDKIIHDNEELENNKNQIIETLKNYDISIQKIAATVGPTVTLYEIVPAAGIRISRIRNLEDDIALSLAALGIRIIAPIPGKGTIGIEVPNVKKSVVSMKTLLASEKFQHNKMSLPIAIGKKIDNENFIVDLATMPHLLMAGATGQGKSVGINALLVSLLYKKHPSQLKLVLVDPKKVELSIYRLIEKHFLAKLPGEEEAIITDTKKVIHTLNALCIEMDNRYDLLKEAGARNIREYNEKFVHRKLNPQKGHQYLPFIVLVIDEFADLIMTAGKEVEMPIARLAQLARAVGIHLIIATQRPSVNIITGTIKANFPARIAFKVSSKIDSRTILDTGGAEQLIGKGDMLISYNGDITRLQCAFVDTPEVEQIVEHIGMQRGYPEAFLLPEYVDEKDLDSNGGFSAGEKDPLFEDAARVIVQNQQGSTSLLQRRMKLGYNRAGRLMDQLESAGIVGPNLGSKAREVLIKTEMELEEYLQQLG